MNPLDFFEQKQMRKDIPNFKVGDTLKVYCRVKEGDKERIQVFEGIAIARHRGGLRSTFTVRKISYGIGVERIFPLHTPSIERIEVVTVGRVRRAKLYYLRHLSGKKARISAKDTRRQGKKGVAALVSPAEAPQAQAVADTEVAPVSS